MPWSRKSLAPSLLRALSRNRPLGSRCAHRLGAGLRHQWFEHELGGPVPSGQICRDFSFKPACCCQWPYPLASRGESPAASTLGFQGAAVACSSHPAGAAARRRSAGDERQGMSAPGGLGPHGVTGRLRASPPTRRPTPVRDQAAVEADDLAGHSRPQSACLAVQRRGPAARHSWSPVATRQVHSRPPAPKPAAGAAVPMCGAETRQTSPAALRRRPCTSC